MSPEVGPREPASPWAHSFFSQGLLGAPAYGLDETKTKIKLDQNEMPWDFPAPLKGKILERVSQREWNRYPSPFTPELNQALSHYLGVPAANIFTGPGSNYLITLLFEALGHQLKGVMWVARPSFALFESQCRYTGLRYEPWLLDQDLNYNLDALSTLPPGSLVVFASPNNPTGSVISMAQLDGLLAAHPLSLFIADEAYFEFGSDNYLSLLAKYGNLILIRTLSKTMGAAGVRLGYVVAAERFIEQLVKLRLPYLLNHFTVEATMAIFEDRDLLSYCQQNVRLLVSERDRLHRALAPIAARQGFEVRNTSANFLFLRWTQPEAAHEFYTRLLARGILVRDISKGPGLAGCLRISVGTQDENDALIGAAAQ